jgi:hypothetical protein
MRNNRTFILSLLGGLAVIGVGLASPANAAEPGGEEKLARALAGLDVAYARHTREHRMAEIQWNLERQNRMRRYQRDDYRYGRGRGYGPPPGYGYRRGYGGGAYRDYHPAQRGSRF